MRFTALATLLSIASAVSAAPIEARAQVLSETIAWPSSEHAAGTISYQYQITPASGSSYTIGFYNSAAPNSGANYKYTAAAVGSGSDGTSVSKTLSPGTSATYTVQKSGTQIKFTIDSV